MSATNTAPSASSSAATGKTVPRGGPSPGSTVDAGEIARFSAIAAEWWDPRGKFKPLHKYNPIRIGYIRDAVCARFGRDPAGVLPLQGLRIVDIGCGGGLLAEPLARLGAEVVGIDAAERNIKVASLHAAELGVTVDYRNTTAEALAEAGEKFDVVLALEVVEHVADVPLFLQSLCGLLEPGGMLFLATINRTPKAFALAIVGAEYVLRWLPQRHPRLAQVPEAVGTGGRAAPLWRPS